MLKRNFWYLLFAVFFSACNNNDKSETAKTPDADTADKSQPEPIPVLPQMPSYVVYKNWEPGKPQNAELILNVYKAWDSESTSNMANYFADSTAYDLPDGTRATTTNTTIESKFRKWRNAYKETSNVPFSLISLYNKDRDQEWVIAWTWNKWTYNDGKKDSMLYCDNWRIKGGKIEYLNSLQNRPSKQLSKRLNEAIPK
jgi:hypothetical protein